MPAYGRKMSVLRKITLLIMSVLLPVLLLTACSGIGNVDPVVQIQVEEMENTSVGYGEDLDLEGIFLLVKRESGRTQKIALKSDMIYGFNNNVVGPQTLDILYEGATTKLYINVTDISVTGLSIRSVPEEIVVTQGAELNLAGVSINIEYDNNTVPQDNITKEMIVGYNPEWEPGNHTVYIEYSGHRVPLEIRVVERALTDMEIYTKPSDLQYFVGETFNPDGLSLLLKYDNGSQQILDYQDISVDDIEFEFNFEIPGAANPIIISFKGLRTLPNDLTAVVADPRIVSLEVYTMPITKGLTVSGETFKSPLTAIVERDQIDWATGVLSILYDNGDVSEVSMEKNEIYLYLGARNGELIPKDYRFNSVGNKKIYVKYGNENVFALIDINVIAKTPFELNVADIKNKLERDHIDGERITTDFLRYNILYNNATYAFDPLDTESWGRLNESLLADDGSTLDIKLANADELGNQTINFQVGAVKAGFTVKVVPNTPTSIKVVEPTRNYVALGSSEVPLQGSSIYVEMKYGNPVLLSPIPEEYVSYEDNEGNPVESFEENGDYKLVVNYKGAIKKVDFFVEDYEIYQISLNGVPSSSYREFSEIPINLMTMTVYYRVPDGQDIVQYNVPVSTAYLYSYDMYKVGIQTVIIRYKGCTTSFEVNISPNDVSALGLCVPPQIVYHAGVNQNLDTNMRIRYVFGDGTYREEDLSGVLPAYWDFSGYNLETPGKQKVKVTRSFGSYSRSFEYDIEVLEESQEVHEISFDHTQMGMTQISGQWVLIVGYREDINTRFYVEYIDNEGENQVATGILQLSVRYTEGGDYQLIDLQPQYITRSSYDRFYDVIDPQTGEIVKFRTATIEYGGKQTSLNIYIASRDLESISVLSQPTITNYAVGQELKLNGGILKLNYVNSSSNPDPLLDFSTYQILPMTDIFVISSGYDKTKTVPGALFITQNVQFSCWGKTTTSPVRTYVKVSPIDYLKMSKIAQNYGMISSPIATITHPVVSFNAPSVSISFLIGDIWSNTPPVYPGEYQMKVSVIENDYFLGGDYVLQGTKFQINKKAIDVQVDYLSKEYGTGDPVFTWKTINNTFLEPGDQLRIIITREQGESVRFDTFGNVIGYDFYWSFDPVDPGQSDRYIIIPVFDTFVVNQKVVPSGVSVNFQEVAGSGGRIYTASYVFNNITQTIRSEDLIYYVNSTGEMVDSDGDGQLDGLPPTSPGEYYVQLSDNYNVVDPGAGRSATFIVQ